MVTKINMSTMPVSVKLTAKVLSFVPHSKLFGSRTPHISISITQNKNKLKPFRENNYPQKIQVYISSYLYDDIIN